MCDIFLSRSLVPRRLAFCKIEANSEWEFYAKWGYICISHTRQTMTRTKRRTVLCTKQKIERFNARTLYSSRAPITCTRLVLPFFFVFFVLLFFVVGVDGLGFFSVLFNVTVISFWLDSKLLLALCRHLVLSHHLFLTKTRLQYIVAECISWFDNNVVI